MNPATLCCLGTARAEFTNSAIDPVTAKDDHVHKKTVVYRWVRRHLGSVDIWFSKDCRIAESKSSLVLRTLGLHGGAKCVVFGAFHVGITNRSSGRIGRLGDQHVERYGHLESGFGDVTFYPGGICGLRHVQLSLLF